MSKPHITKAQLIELLNLWGESEISTPELQDWMLTNYDPPDVDIGLNEPEWIQDAMNIVMNEYEVVKLDKIVVENYTLALKFIGCSESSYTETKHDFIRNGFMD